MISVRNVTSLYLSLRNEGTVACLEAFAPSKRCPRVRSNSVCFIFPTPWHLKHLWMDGHPVPRNSVRFVSAPQHQSCYPDRIVAFEKTHFLVVCPLLLQLNQKNKLRPIHRSEEPSVSPTTQTPTTLWACIRDITKHYKTNYRARESAEIIPQSIGTRQHNACRHNPLRL